MDFAWSPSRLYKACPGSASSPSPPLRAPAGTALPTYIGY